MRRGAGSRSAGVAAVALVVTVLSGCGGEPRPSATSMTARPSSAALGAPTSGSGQSTSFDPCTALTPSFLASHQWDARPPATRQESTGDARWKGCLFVAQSAYTFRVQTTNGTLAQVREKFTTATDLTIAGRRALRYEARPDVPGGCTINVDMKTGSLYILVDDPRGLHPRKLSPCAAATEIAEAVVPLLPPGS
ncbi:DUF3558 domain-containing protein [Nocardia sp. NBC_01009]|uniref:DUF3558 domain-containing protein n=1 Tax=Nocardia sp. NBC_01009 TaxID=2975996 RepID=UPI00386EDA6B|nr:DUF3558 domain-containing protein [Nocardia sp. NBC_01009]